ncbi:hypothetical protein DIPPA_23127 [Diplonema papillatum]|nr:hypothetical protein DIPPA_23127 [Diplonema papillatum]
MPLTPGMTVVNAGGVLASAWSRRHSRVGRFWESESLKAAVVTSEWIFLQRLRAHYYFRWRIYAACNVLVKQYRQSTEQQETLLQERTKLRTDVHALERENDTLRAENKRLLQEIEALQNALRALTADFQDEQQRRREAESARTADGPEFAALRTERDILLAEVTTLRQNLTHLELRGSGAGSAGGQLAEAEAEIARLRRLLEQQHRLSAAETHGAASQATGAAQVRQSSLLETTANNWRFQQAGGWESDPLRKLIVTAESDLDTLKQTLRDKESTLKAHRDTASQRQYHRDDERWELIQDDIHQLRDTVGHREAAVKALRLRYREGTPLLKEEWESILHQWRDTERRTTVHDWSERYFTFPHEPVLIATAEAMVRELEVLAREKEKQAAEIRKEEGGGGDGGQDLETLELELRRVKAELRQRKGDLDAMRQRAVASIQTDIHALEATLKEKERDADDLKRTSRPAGTHTDTSPHAQEELERVEYELARLKDEMRDRHVDLDEMRRRTVAAAEADVRELLRELTEREARAADLKNEARLPGADDAAYKREIDRRDDEIRDMCKELEARTTAFERLRQRAIGEAEAEIHELEATLKHNLREVEELRRESQSYRRDPSGEDARRVATELELAEHRLHQNQEEARGRRVALDEMRHRSVTAAEADVRGLDLSLKEAEAQADLLRSESRRPGSDHGATRHALDRIEPQLSRRRDELSDRRARLQEARASVVKSAEAGVADSEATLRLKEAEADAARREARLSGLHSSAEARELERVGHELQRAKDELRDRKATLDEMRCRTVAAAEDGVRDTLARLKDAEARADELGREAQLPATDRDAAEAERRRLEREILRLRAELGGRGTAFDGARRAAAAAAEADIRGLEQTLGEKEARAAVLRREASLAGAGATVSRMELDGVEADLRRVQEELRERNAALKALRLGAVATAEAEVREVELALRDKERQVDGLRRSKLSGSDGAGTAPELDRASKELHRLREDLHARKTDLEEMRLQTVTNAEAGVRDLAVTLKTRERRADELRRDAQRMQIGDDSHPAIRRELERTEYDLHLGEELLREKTLNMEGTRLTHIRVAESELREMETALKEKERLAEEMKRESKLAGTDDALGWDDLKQVEKLREELREKTITLEELRRRAMTRAEAAIQASEIVVKQKERQAEDLKREHRRKLSGTQPETADAQALHEELERVNCELQQAKTDLRHRRLALHELMPASKRRSRLQPVEDRTTFSLHLERTAELDATTRMSLTQSITRRADVHAVYDPALIAAIEAEIRGLDTTLKQDKSKGRESRLTGATSTSNQELDENEANRRKDELRRRKFELEEMRLRALSKAANEIRELEWTVRDTEQQAADLKRETRAAGTQSSANRMDLERLDDELNRLKEELRTRRAALVDMRQRATTQTEGEIRELETTVQEKEREVAALRRKSALGSSGGAAKAGLQQAQHEWHVLHDDLRDQKATLEAMRRMALANAEAEARDAAMTLKHAENLADELRAEAKHTGAQGTMSGQELAKLEPHLLRIKHELDDRKHNLDVLRRRAAATADAEIRKLEMTLREKEGEETALRRASTAAGADSAAQKELEGLQFEMYRIKEELKERKIAREELRHRAESSAEAEIRDLQAALRKKEKEADELRTEAKLAGPDAAAGSKELGRVEHDIERLQEELKGRKAALEGMRHRSVADAEAGVQELDVTVKDKEGQAVELRKEFRHAEVDAATGQELDKVESELLGAKEELRARRIALEDMRLRGVSSVQADIRELEKKLREKENEAAAARRESRHAGADSRSRKEADRLDDEVRRIKEELREKRGTLHEERLEGMSSAEAEIHELEKTVRDKERQAEELRTQSQLPGQDSSLRHELDRLEHELYITKKDLKNRRLALEETRFTTVYDAQAEVRALEMTLKEKENEADEARRASKLIGADGTASKQELERLEHDLQQMRDELKTRKRALEKMRLTAVSATQADVLELEMTLKDRTRQAEELRKESRNGEYSSAKQQTLERLEYETSETREELNDRQRALEELRLRSVSAIQGEIRELEATLQEKEREAAGLRRDGAGSADRKELETLDHDVHRIKEELKARKIALQEVRFGLTSPAEAEIRELERTLHNLQEEAAAHKTILRHGGASPKEFEKLEHDVQRLREELHTRRIAQQEGRVTSGAEVHELETAVQDAERKADEMRRKLQRDRVSRAELEKLEHEVQRIEDELAVRKSALRAAGTSSRAEADLAELEGTLRDKEHGLDELTRKSRHASTDQKELERLEYDVQRVREDLDSRRLALKEGRPGTMLSVEADIRELEATLKDTERRADELRRRLKRESVSQSELERLEYDVQQMREELHARRSALNENIPRTVSREELEIRELEMTLHDRKRETDDLRTRLRRESVSKDELRSLEHDVQMMREELKARKNSLRGSRPGTMLHEEAEGLERLEFDVERVREELKTRRMSQKGTRPGTASHEAEILELEITLKEKEKEADRLRRNSRRESASQKELERLESEVQKIRDQLASRKSVLQDMRPAATHDEAEILELEMTLSDKERDADACRRKLAHGGASQKEVDRLESDIQKLQEELDTRRIALREVAPEIKSQEAEIHDLELTLREREREADEQRRKVRLERAGQNELGQIEQEVQQTRDQLSSRRLALLSMRPASTHDEADLPELERTLRDKERETDEYRRKLRHTSTNQKELEKLEYEVLRLREELSSRKSALREVRPMSLMSHEDTETLRLETALRDKEREADEQRARARYNSSSQKESGRPYHDALGTRSSAHRETKPAGSLSYESIDILELEMTLQDKERDLDELTRRSRRGNTDRKEVDELASDVQRMREELESRRTVRKKLSGSVSRAEAEIRQLELILVDREASLDDLQRSSRHGSSANRKEVEMLQHDVQRIREELHARRIVLREMAPEAGTRDESGVDELELTLREKETELEELRLRPRRGSVSRVTEVDTLETEIEIIRERLDGRRPPDRPGAAYREESYTRRSGASGNRPDSELRDEAAIRDLELALRSKESLLDSFRRSARPSSPNRRDSERLEHEVETIRAQLDDLRGGGRTTRTKRLGSVSRDEGGLREVEAGLLPSEERDLELKRKTARGSLGGRWDEGETTEYEVGRVTDARRKPPPSPRHDGWASEFEQDRAEVLALQRELDDRERERELKRKTARGSLGGRWDEGETAEYEVGRAADVRRRPPPSPRHDGWASEFEQDRAEVLALQGELEDRERERREWAARRGRDAGSLALEEREIAEIEAALAERERKAAALHAELAAAEQYGSGGGARRAADEIERELAKNKEALHAKRSALEEARGRVTRDKKAKEEREARELRVLEAEIERLKAALKEKEEAFEAKRRKMARERAEAGSADSDRLHTSLLTMEVEITHRKKQLQGRHDQIGSLRRDLEKSDAHRALSIERENLGARQLAAVDSDVRELKRCLEEQEKVVGELRRAESEAKLREAARREKEARDQQVLHRVGGEIEGMAKALTERERIAEARREQVLREQTARERNQEEAELEAAELRRADDLLRRAKEELLKKEREASALREKAELKEKQRALQREKEEQGIAALEQADKEAARVKLLLAEKERAAEAIRRGISEGERERRREDGIKTQLHTQTARAQSELADLEALMADAEKKAADVKRQIAREEVERRALEKRRDARAAELRDLDAEVGAGEQRLHALLSNAEVLRASIEKEDRERALRKEKANRDKQELERTAGEIERLRDVLRARERDLLRFRTELQFDDGDDNTDAQRIAREVTSIKQQIELQEQEAGQLRMRGMSPIVKSPREPSQSGLYSELALVNGDIETLRRMLDEKRTVAHTLRRSRSPAGRQPTGERRQDLAALSREMESIRARLEDKRREVASLETGGEPRRLDFSGTRQAPTGYDEDRAVSEGGRSRTSVTTRTKITTTTRTEVFESETGSRSSSSAGSGDEDSKERTLAVGRGGVLRNREFDDSRRRATATGARSTSPRRGELTAEEWERRERELAAKRRNTLESHERSASLEAERAERMSEERGRERSRSQGTVEATTREEWEMREEVDAGIGGGGPRQGSRAAAGADQRQRFERQMEERERRRLASRERQKSEREDRIRQRAAAARGSPGDARRRGSQGSAGGRSYVWVVDEDGTRRSASATRASSDYTYQATRTTTRKTATSRKTKEKYYPELGVCLTDTVPRPLSRGRKNAQPIKRKRNDGIKVVGVRGPAKRAGILPDDYIRRVNGVPTPTLDEFRDAMRGIAAKQPLEITIERQPGHLAAITLVPNASTEVPGHTFQRFVWLQRGEKTEVDVDRLAAPKGHYYDEFGKLQPLYDEEAVCSRLSRSPPPTPHSSRSISPHRPASRSPVARSPMSSYSKSQVVIVRRESVSPHSRYEDPACEGSWTWVPDSPRRSPASVVSTARHLEEGVVLPPPAMQAYQPTPSVPPQPTLQGKRPALFIKVGARVKRNPAFWQWGNQDGGVGCLGTVAKVDKALGWVTVRWDTTGRGSTYRWGKDDAYDVEEVPPGQLPQGVLEASRPPAPRQKPSSPAASHSALHSSSRTRADEAKDGDGYPPGHAPNPTL